MATVGNESRPAYVYDLETDTWVPIGIGPHTHDEYIDKTIITAKGDIVVGVDLDTPGILYVGEDNQVLTANSSATNGVEWATQEGYRLVETIYYTSSGTFTKATYPWLRAVTATVVAGGGGGGGAAATGASQSTTGGPGGGGGAAIANLIPATSLGESVTVTVGAGGAGGTAGANNGSSGGASSFGTFASAAGGGGGDGQTAGTAPRAGAIGGERASGTVGDLRLTSSGGQRGFTISVNAGQIRPAGGHSALFINGQESLFTNGDGLGGKNPGTGGSGGGNVQSITTARSGGSGDTGIVILELYA